MATASPSPFSPNPTNPQMSPVHSDQASRVGTPVDNPNSYLQPGPFTQHFNQGQYGPPVGGFNGNMPINASQSLAPQSMQQGISPQQRAYQMQIQVQARQLQAQAAQSVSPGGAINHLGNPNMPSSSPHMASVPPGPQPARSQLTPEAFARGLQTFMQYRGASVNVNPVICGRPMNLMQLFFYLVKSGGFAKITKMNQWPLVAQHFAFPPPHLGQAAHELREYWSRNVAPYEAAWFAKQQRQGQQIRHPSAESDPQLHAHHQVSPGPHEYPNPDFASQQHEINSTTAPNSTPHTPMMNGYMPPSQVKDASHQVQPMAHHRPNSSRQIGESPVNGLPYPPAKRLDSGQGKALAMPAEAPMPKKQPLEDPFKPEVLPGNESHMHGPINVDEMMTITNSLLELRPVVPTLRELGTIDIHALNMSLKSGITAEVRLALDTLTTLSLDPNVHLALDGCDDMVEALIDCAHDQIDQLAKNATEVSDEMLISSYEDVIRSCRLESESLQEVHEMGSDEYDLDRAVDRLICITTLIRNFSFYESSFAQLGLPEVVRMLTTGIKHLGTKEMFLRTHRNTLDFMKDVIIYLSNLSHSIQLPGKEEAWCLLHFLLSFAPGPPPVATPPDGITFASYNPNIHKYTPSAVVSLAKLLARDEPNRRYYRAIFSADSSSVTGASAATGASFSSPSHELLTRTFGLAISPIPTNTKGSALTLVEARKPFLLQGLLAAEMLSNLAPGSDSDVARWWLGSTDGFALTLLKLVLLLASVSRPPPAPPTPSRHPQQRGIPPEPDADAISAIMHRGIAVLRRLAEKSQASGGQHGDGKLPLGLVPRRENLVGALVSKDVDPYVVRQLCLYAGLED